MLESRNSWTIGRKYRKKVSRERGKEEPLFIVYLRLSAITPSAATRPVPPGISNIFVDSSNGSAVPVGRG